MLVLSRMQNESVIISGAKPDDEVRVVLVDVRDAGKKVRLGFEAPKHVAINRDEIQRRIDREAVEALPRAGAASFGGRGEIRLTLSGPGASARLGNVGVEMSFDSFRELADTLYKMALLTGPESDFDGFMDSLNHSLSEREAG